MFGFIVLQLKHVILLRTLGMYNTTILVISLHVAELPRHVQIFAELFKTCAFQLIEQVEPWLITTVLRQLSQQNLC